MDELASKSKSSNSCSHASDDDELLLSEDDETEEELCRIEEELVIIEDEIRTRDELDWIPKELELCSLGEDIIEEELLITDVEDELNDKLEEELITDEELVTEEDDFAINDELDEYIELESFTPELEESPSTSTIVE